MKISDIAVREIVDSRGEPTIELIVTDHEGRLFRAAAPSGKSKGAREVSTLSFSDARVAVEKIKETVAARVFATVGEIDAFLLGIDGTPEKRILGGNVMLGVSIAAARALAHEQKRELWEVIRAEYFDTKEEERAPLIFSNFVNGGSHANNNLDIQEYMVVARTDISVARAVRRLIELYRATGERLKQDRKLNNIPIGDEGGYSLDFSDNFEPLALLESLIDAHDLERECMTGLDAAASHFGAERGYTLREQHYTREKLVALYQEYCTRAKLLFSIEDPFGENDTDGFAQLRKALPEKWVVGDDLTTTNAAAIEARAREGAINAVIIKPNQIGTIAETCAAIQAGRRHDVKIIVSHRSGETEDAFIIELAKACRADGVKIGAPAKERLIKFNELLRLYPDHTHDVG